MARESMANSQIFRYRDNASILQRRMGLCLSDLPPDLAERQFAELKTTGARAVQEAARVYRPMPGFWLLSGKWTRRRGVRGSR